MHLVRLHRLLKLAGLLQSGKPYCVEGLATECGVSRRTVFRDLDTLRESGLPVEYDEEMKRYRIPRTFYLPPTNFTLGEALSLIVLCHEMGKESGLPFLGPARSAALKVESTLPNRLRDKLESLIPSVQLRAEPTNPLDAHKPIYDKLLAAISHRRCVRIGYDSLTEWENISTRLSPFHLLFSRRSWYVIGRSSMHRSNRTFNVGRILELQILDDAFKIPRGFSIERYLGNAWHLIPEKGPDSQVVVRFTKMVAQNVAEVGWHKTQQVKFNDDRTMDFQVTVSGLNEISWWILGYGDQAEVLRPAKLRRLIARRARRMVEIYNGR